MSIPKHLEQVIKKQVVSSEEPNEFRIIGLCNQNVDIYTSAIIAFEKISEWINRENSLIELKYDQFKRIFVEEIKYVSRQKN